MRDVRWSCWINNEYSELVFLYSGSVTVNIYDRGERFMSRIKTVTLMEPFETYEEFERFCQDHAIETFEES